MKRLFIGIFLFCVFCPIFQLEEPYVQHLGNAPVELNQFGPMEIPTGQLFVAGDQSGR